MMKLSPAMRALALLLSAVAVQAAETAGERESPTKEPWQLAQQTEVWQPVPPVVSAPADAPPSDAVVLFDGGSLDQWQSVGGRAAEWQLEGQAMVVKPGAGDIRTRKSFCDLQLHLEWRTPVRPVGNDGKPLAGQARGNSGVFLQERYEVQVLDSWQNETYANGQAGSIYKQHIPLVNASRPPGEWQTYDIVYTAPRFGTEDELLSPARITVLHNGVLIQNNVEIQGATAWIGEPRYQAHGCAPLRLQDHGNPVSFRNIWAREL